MVLAADRRRPCRLVMPAGRARGWPPPAQHIKAVLPYVLGGDYQLEHWLACYAVLMLS